MLDNKLELRPIIADGTHEKEVCPGLSQLEQLLDNLLRGSADRDLRRNSGSVHRAEPFADFLRRTVDRHVHPLPDGERTRSRPSASRYWRSREIMAGKSADGLAPAPSHPSANLAARLNARGLEAPNQTGIGR